mgnify:CR=1 FL=1
MKRAGTPVSALFGMGGGSAVRYPLSAYRPPLSTVILGKHWRSFLEGYYR